VVRACNPSDSGGGDREDHGLRAAWAKRLGIERLTVGRSWFQANTGKKKFARPCLNRKKL
jgi:hypothetical protein